MDTLLFRTFKDKKTIKIFSNRHAVTECLNKYVLSALMMVDYTFSLYCPDLIPFLNLLCSKR